ncbi:MAG: Undecaprenyl-diphosphatase [Candidatus Uhrbacteria bacterium GW2011_GWE2_45_35]|uniref:Undecaprenyl-diphosphatase n=2 Tax=Candidatus Uhriibacteriota TaxID=1752732 RepID=A0A0G1J8A4_9BACT|nr:MAG: Undecaprenyl-diphosphatase [Candidatus Uhrbacteria bacterium GW2011_GWF2_44_350]KKU05456.1 MAG: Undecaprenyl-diphosphatase [Candidatus Uhrbacteria bacterium GW2011_GWE2_45_35]HBR81122.1 undecaprenyl-diphosphatase UppP [Candidatus Uhrbacteria bacterium]HCU31125.1 undecaprenyl-diphosphatase UppP [Candidatus Uhrbacteria bacterium]
MPIQPFILGLIQGLTEFLPISSSGHLILIPKLFGWAEQGLAFDATIHLATLAAVIVALWVDVKTITLGVFKRNENGRLGWLILTATVPVLAVGFFFNDWFETVFRSPLVVAASLAFWGVILWIADAWTKKQAEDHLEKIGWKRTVIICLSQIIAFIPGTSRSGITITAGLFGGLSREAAARFSFLLGIPAIAAAGGYSLLKIIYGGESVDWLSLTVAFAAAFVSGFFAIKFLLKIMKAASYKWFAIYRIILAAVILLFFL